MASDKEATPSGNRVLRLIGRFAPAIVLVGGLAWAMSSGALHHLSLDTLRESRVTLHAFVREHPAQAVALYLAAYLAVVSLSLPGVLIMTMTGGFLFGPWLGGPIADIGCTTGSVIVYVVCRLTVGDSLEKRASPSIKAFEEGFRKDAFFYLLTLRLIPVTPFWLVNLAAGLIGVPLRAFIAATLIGAGPSSMIYASLGSGLDRMFDSGQKLGLHMVMTPRILVPLTALALLSILPIVYHRWRARRPAA